MGIKDIRDLLLRINREHGTTILISSHILRELYEIATDFIFIDSGEIIREISKEPLNKRLRAKRSSGHGRWESPGCLAEARLGRRTHRQRRHDHSVRNGFTEEELGAILHESEAVLLEFTQRRETLESYFISLIGGNSHA